MPRGQRKQKKKEEKKEENIEDSKSDSNKKNCKSRAYKFNPDWMKQSSHDYKDWISESKQGDQYYYCKICKEDLKINTIWGEHAHHNSKEHKNQISKQIEIHSSTNKYNDKEALTNKVREFKIELANFIVQNHLSFITGDKILRFIKRHCQDYEIIKQANLSDDKISKLIRECIKPTIINILKNKLEDIPFSLSFDETTHKLSKKKYFAIMIQFYDEKLGNLQSYLHAFKESSESSDSESMYKILKNQVFDEEIGKNVIGISMDNANVNKGVKKSISKSIVDNYPYIWCNYCLCHSCNLITKFASKAIPSSVEKVLHITYKYFSKSPKRSSKWLSLQLMLGVKELIINKYIETRWLSEEFCISRILKRWVMR